MKLRKRKQMIAIPLIVILLLTLCLYGYPRQLVAAQESSESNVFQGERFKAAFCLDSTYEGGYNARIELTNTSNQTIEDWTLAFSFEENITNVWNGTLKKLEDGKYQIQNAGWNQDIRAGETITFGFSGSCTQTPNAPSDYKLVGEQCTADSSEYSIACELEDQWDTGYIVQVDIKNLTAFTMKDWMLGFALGSEIESLWGAEVFAHSGSTYQVRSNYNQNISAYNTVSFHYIVTSSTYVEPCNFKLYYQSLDNALVESPKPTVSVVTEETVSSEEPVVTEETVSSEEPAVTEEQPTANPTESVQPADSEIPVTSEAPVTSTPPLESEEPEEEQEIDMTDTDGDGLIDALEEMLGTDSLLADTDGDLLTDYEEVYLVGTAPLLIDTDGNGIMDAYDDIDLDGLANKEELNLGTSAVCTDSDYDGLNDGEEVNQYGTEPLNEDTDGDTITDGDEILLGLNPLLADTDKDGIADNEEKIEQTFSAAIEDEEKTEVTKVEIAFAGTGNIEDTTEIESVYGEDLYSSNLVGLVGAPIEIETESEFDSATITFSYDESKLGEVEEENLAIMWYDEENHNYVQMESVVDKEKNTVSCETTHFSTYLLVNLLEWLNCWKTPHQSADVGCQDIAIVCENSRYSIGLVDTVINFMCTEVVYNLGGIDNFCEIEFGESACAEIEFGDIISIKTRKDRELYSDAILYEAKFNDKMDTGYGFNASLGLELALDELEKLDSVNQQTIFLICTGKAMDDISEQVQRAIELGVAITTVNFMNGSYTEVLKNVAEQTGGNWIDISDCELYNETDIDEIQYRTRQAFPFIDERNQDVLDTDGDGILDIYEKNGIRATNGQIVYSDPSLADTDGDGLTDKEELNLKTDADTGEVVAYLCSYPTAKDSDNDGLSDSEDPYPNTPKGVNFTIVDSFSSFPDVKVVRDKINKDVEDYKSHEGIYENISISTKEKKELENIKDDAITQYKIACAGKMQAGYLLRNYINGNGKLYNMPISGMITTSSNVQKHFVNNVYRMLKACKRSVKSGYTQRIKTAYSPKTGQTFPFSDVTSSFKDVVTEFDLFSGINDSEAGMICECTKDGGLYKVELRYYLLDYYDYSKKITSNVGFVSPLDLYRLNQVGMARNFEVRGCETYKFIFNDEQDLKSVIKKHL